MCHFVERLGVKKIRFAELQNCPALQVYAMDIFPSIPIESFKNGCEITVPHKTSEVLVRVTCGLVDANKPPVVDPTGRDPQSRVMSGNLQIIDSWLDANMQHSGGRCK